jgi:hypothetical protein
MNLIKRSRMKALKTYPTWGRLRPLNTDALVVPVELSNWHRGHDS